MGCIKPHLENLDNMLEIFGNIPQSFIIILEESRINQDFLSELKNKKKEHIEKMSKLVIEDFENKISEIIYDLYTKFATLS